MEIKNLTDRATKATLECFSMPMEEMQDYHGGVWCSFYEQGHLVLLYKLLEMRLEAEGSQTYLFNKLSCLRRGLGRE